MDGEVVGSIFICMLGCSDIMRDSMSLLKSFDVKKVQWKAKAGLDV